MRKKIAKPVGEWLSVERVADIAKLHRGHVRKLCAKLADSGQARRVRGDGTRWKWEINRSALCQLSRSIQVDQRRELLLDPPVLIISGGTTIKIERSAGPVRVNFNDAASAS